MKKQLSHEFFLFFVVFVPSMFIVLADFIIGDYELFIFINQGIVNSVLDVACVYASSVFFFCFYLLVLVKLYVSHKVTSMASGVISLMTGPLSYGIGSLIKLVVRRPRPFNVFSNVRVLGPLETSSFSFPSTTTMLAFGLAIPILLEKRQYGVILSVLSYFIGFSVIYTGFHFPADVAVGTLFSLGVTICTNRLKEPIVDFLERHGACLSRN